MVGIVAFRSLYNAGLRFCDLHLGQQLNVTADSLAALQLLNVLRHSLEDLMLGPQVSVRSLYCLLALSDKRFVFVVLVDLFGPVVDGIRFWTATRRPARRLALEKVDAATGYLGRQLSNLAFSDCVSRLPGAKLLCLRHYVASCYVQGLPLLLNLLCMSGQLQESRRFLSLLLL